MKQKPQLNKMINPSPLLAEIWRTLPKPLDWGQDRRFWIAGGAPRRAVENAAIVNDVDLFFTGSKAFHSFVELAHRMPGARITVDKPHALEIEIQVYVSINAGKQPFLLQCVRHEFFDDMKSLLADFDYTICQFAFDGVHIWYAENALEHLMARKLVAANISMPTAALRRLIKYREQGFRADDDTIRTILRAAVSDPSSIDKEVVSYESTSTSTSVYDPQFAEAGPF